MIYRSQQIRQAYNTTRQPLVWIWRQNGSVNTKKSDLVWPTWNLTLIIIICQCKDKVTSVFGSSRVNINAYFRAELTFWGIKFNVIDISLRTKVGHANNIYPYVAKVGHANMIYPYVVKVGHANKIYPYVVKVGHANKIYPYVVRSDMLTRYIPT